MNREQIIKALEHCGEFGSCDEECPYFDNPHCPRDLRKDALALIKELIEKNERLRAIPEQLHKEMSERMIEERKIERKLAVREMQERLKAKAYTNNYCQEVVLMGDIDQIAREMQEGLT